MMTESEIDRLFDEGFDCSQIVFAAVSEKLGISVKEAYRISSCFGIGIAQGSVCGAATGALMALGLKYGNDSSGDFEKKSILFDKRDEFIRKFSILNGNVMCPDLLGRRIDTLGELMLTRGEGLYKNCPRYCANAIKILEEML